MCQVVLKEILRQRRPPAQPLTIDLKPHLKQDRGMSSSLVIRAHTTAPAVQLQMAVHGMVWLNLGPAASACRLRHSVTEWFGIHVCSSEFVGPSMNAHLHTYVCVYDEFLCSGLLFLTLCIAVSRFDIRNGWFCLRRLAIHCKSLPAHGQLSKTWPALHSRKMQKLGSFMSQLLKPWAPSSGAFNLYSNGRYCRLMCICICMYISTTFQMKQKPICGYAAMPTFNRCLHMYNSMKSHSPEEARL